MRTFNPEKELRKIQKGNKNKVILGVIALLLVIAIGSSYALYQIKYNKRIIYTTVDKFYSKDMQLAVYIEGVKKDAFPDKDDGYVFSDYKCENNTIITFDYNDWMATVTATGPDKCTLSFVKSPFYRESCSNKTMAECLLTNPEEISQLANDDPDSNSRYIGENPNNYIWFNCDDYSTPSEETCERWRIIGAFNNMEKVVSVSEDGETTYEKQNLVKIIRADSIGGIAWGSKNNWKTASLQTSLNITYYDGTALKDGKGITEDTRSIIEKVKWNLGGQEGSFRQTAKASDWYEAERGTIVPTNASSNWDGYIGLIYLSDYGYATAGNYSGTDRQFCLDSPVFDYDSVTYCYEKNWLYTSSYDQWVLSPVSDSDDLVFNIKKTGWTNNNGALAANAVRPTLYLTSNVKILNGSGSYSSPYTITTD